MKASIISITEEQEHLKNANSSPTLDQLDQQLWRCDPAVWGITNSLGDSKAAEV